MLLIFIINHTLLDSSIPATDTVPLLFREVRRRSSEKTETDGFYFAFDLRGPWKKICNVTAYTRFAGRRKPVNKAVYY